MGKITQSTNDGRRTQAPEIQTNKIDHFAGLQFYPAIKPDATVAAKATDSTIGSTDFGKNITNTGASATVTLTLPDAADYPDEGFKVQLTVAQIVRLAPPASGSVYVGGSGVADKYAQIAGVIGNYADVYCDGANYHITGYSGVVTKEA